VKVIHGSGNWKEKKSPLGLALGNFDGVHRGHQAILARLRERSAELGVPSDRPRRFAFAGLVIAERDRELIEWAQGRKDNETLHRPDVNIYKRTLVETWDQVIRKLREQADTEGAKDGR